MSEHPAPRTSRKHAELGEAFYDVVAPADFPQTVLRHRNQAWADRVGLGGLNEAEWIAHFGRFKPLSGTFEQPLALRYHGHQFRTYNADLGDGRGFLFAQLHDLRDGRLLDLATKGTGRTPWSRGGDGRLTLKGGVREVLATAMLEAIGVDTSKSFSLIETGEELQRGDEPSPTRSSVLVRLSHSHIRIGTFQRLAFLDDIASLQKLYDYAVETYMPDLPRGDVPAFLRRVCANVARTGAWWIAAGFVHGVLNTDNINITGESFDYGPWRFVPHYDPTFTAAYFDETGLYSFGRQPEALAWNLTKLAECLVPLSEISTLEEALNTFWPAFRREVSLAILKRFGLESAGEKPDADLVTAIFAFVTESKLPYERLFFDWRGGLAASERAAKSPHAETYATESFRPVADALEAFSARKDLNLDHPYFAWENPRTMLIDEMEALWAPIAQSDDWAPLNAALDEIAVMRDAYGNNP